MKLANNERPQSDRRMLISFAHPDDESFGMGGAIAMYAQRGVSIALICSTNGDVGTVDAEFMQGFDTVGELPARLACAAETLGIRADHVRLPRQWHDGHARQRTPRLPVEGDPDVVTGRIVREIRRIRPQVIVTFDPFGGYGHPDHIFMHRATARAFHAAGDPAQFPDQLTGDLEAYQPAKLYYSTFPKLPLRLMLLTARLRGEDPRHMGRIAIRLTGRAGQNAPAHARINVGAFQTAWDAAAGCHASQQNPRQTNGFFSRLQRLVFRHQDFTRAWPEPKPGEPLERDLFAGVN